MPQFRAKIEVQTQIPDLVDPETWFCFKDSIQTTARYIFLQNYGLQESHFKEGNILLQTLKVVNDAGDRGVKLQADCAAIFN